jgi:hypothetical protein
MIALTPEQQELHKRWSEAVTAELLETGFCRILCSVAAAQARDACLKAGFDPKHYRLQQ